MTIREAASARARRMARRLRGRAGPSGWVIHRLDQRRARRRTTGASRIEEAIQAFAASYPRATVVVVGANDGIKRDPLRPHLLTRDWTCYLLEPVPHVYEALRRNTRWIAGAVPVNVAIADRDGELPFYTVRPPGPGETVWPWYDALGSFDRDVVLSHHELIPDIEQRLVTTTVRAVTFDRFVEEHGIDDLDLLLIDTEGHDFHVLSQVDLDTLAPALVVYEHHHLAPDVRRRAEELLRRAGYRTLAEGLDTMAVRTGPDRPARAELVRACAALLD